MFGYLDLSKLVCILVTISIRNNLGIGILGKGVELGKL